MSLSSIQLEAFTTLAQTHNFTRAAEKLHMSQSALSQRIANLEEELGTTLFLRDRAGLKLTETGHELLRYCKTKDVLEEEFLGRLKTQEGSKLSGWIRIGGFSSVMSSVVLPTLANLLRAEPQLQLQTHTRELRELPDLLRRGEVDYVLLDRELVRDDLEAKIIGEEQYVLVERKGYDGPEIYLDHDEEDTTSVAYLKLAKKKSAKLRRFYVDDIHGILEGVRAGLGRAVLPLHLVKGTPDLRVIEPEIVLRSPVVIHYDRRGYYSHLHERVIDTLSDNGLMTGRRGNKEI